VLPDETDRIELLIADVDGTLVTSEKRLTNEAIDAAAALHRAGVQLMITSGRPPRGLAMLVEPLALVTPLAAINGGVFVAPDLSVLASRTIPGEYVPQVHDLLVSRGMSVWVYTLTDWLVTDPDGPHVAREARTVDFRPRVVPSFSGITDVVKLVGVNDDAAVTAAATAAAQQRFGWSLSVSRSQPYYIDVTHLEANKGAVADYAVRELSVPRSAVAAIGDMPNDLMMFAKAGVSIAMGNADPDVKRHAHFVTESNDRNGFAVAVERFVLPRAAAPHHSTIDRSTT
jgi:Cof subfamily protein (haloacid dehalogenase superfamily)